jgi:hypothetical protein
MSKQPLPYGADLPPVDSSAVGALIAYPSWMDARYLLAATEAKAPAELRLSMEGFGAIPGNGQRWGLVVWTTTGTSPVTLTPFGDPANLPLWIVTSGAEALRLTIFEWGALVCFDIQMAGLSDQRVLWSELTIR